MPRAPRDPFHPSLFGPTEVPAGPVHRPRLRPVQPTAALITSAETDLAQLLNDLLRRSVLAQIAASRIDEGGWNLIEGELRRFHQRGGVATIIVGRLFELPRGGSLEPNAWRTAASAALERGLRLWSRVTDGARVFLWPRFQGSVALFDAGGALHALVGSSPFTERALRRNGGARFDDRPTTDDQGSRRAFARAAASDSGGTRPVTADRRVPTADRRRESDDQRPTTRDTRPPSPARCDVTFHLTASDPEWAGGELDLDERATCVAALYRFYSFFNAEMPRSEPGTLTELSPARVAQGLADLSRAVDWVTEASALPGVDAAAVEIALLQRFEAVAPAALRADVTFQVSPSGPGLLLDPAARPLIPVARDAADPVLFRMPQPRHDFWGIVRPTGSASDAPLSVTGVPPSRLTALVRRGQLPAGEALVLLQEGPRTVRVAMHPPPPVPRS